MRNAFDQITFVIHTYDRPQFPSRLMRYFNGVPAMSAAHVVIADGSSDAQGAPFDVWFAAQPVGFSGTPVHRPCKRGDANTGYLS